MNGLLAAAGLGGVTGMPLGVINVASVALAWIPRVPLAVLVAIAGVVRAL